MFRNSELEAHMQISALSSIEVCTKGRREKNNKAHDNFSGVDWAISRARGHDVDGSLVSCPDITIHQNELTKNRSYSRAEMLSQLV